MPGSSRSDFFQPGGRVRVKICGITREEDALAAIECGADALGFNFFPGSKRYVKPEQTLEWITGLPGTCSRVAVVVNAEPQLLERLRGAGCFEALQLHGDEPPEACRQPGFKQVIRAVRTTDDASLRHALEHPAKWLLLDAAVAGTYGGTGRTIDWKLAAAFTLENRDRAVILAGGLDADNVVKAIRLVRPRAVDVAGGVESSPGRKDAAKMRAFMAAAKGA